MTLRSEFESAARAKPARKAPYTFAHTPRKILASPSPDLDLSKGTAEAIHGTLKIEFENKTPLLVGGGDIADPVRSNEDGRNLSPMKMGHDYLLPGSSVKGLIRTVMEIAGHARLSFIDDFTGYTRSFNDATWSNEVKLHQNMPVNGGWLFKADGNYKLVQATETIKYPIDNILALLGLNDNHDEWHDLTIHQRLSQLKQAERSGLRVGTLFGKDQRRMRLVVSAETPAEGRAKNKEYLFVWPDLDGAAPDAIAIDKGTGDRFVASLQKDTATQAQDNPASNFSALTCEGRIHGFECDETSLEHKLNDPDRYGLPVFWRNPEGAGQLKPSPTPILSLTAFLRVPYKRSLHDIINQTQDDLDTDQLDLVQALLGWAPTVETDTPPANRKRSEKAWKSRVKFGFATCKNAKLSAEKTWAATKPRPSYWPYYLKPNSQDAQHPVDYNNPAAILSGRKLYPARNSGRLLPIRGNDKEDRNLTFLEPGAVFASDIRIENLSLIELGALVWALTFGDLSGNQGYFHMLGRAKAHGYGQIKIKIQNATFRCEGGDKDITLEAALSAFVAWVEDQTEGVFNQQEPIRALLAAAHAQTGSELQQHLNFAGAVDGGNDEAILNAYGDLKKKAQKKPQALVRDGSLGLPRYPGPNDG